MVASRLLWAVGYHQPIVYYVPEWKLKSGPGADPIRRAASGWIPITTPIGEWSWTDNPFRGSRQLKGLIVANLLINNWDLKPSNNKIVTVPASRGRRAVVRRAGHWRLVRQDRLAGGQPQPDRRLRAPAVRARRVEDGRVQFDYQARHKELLEDITAADVVWIAELFARITDRQWADAFAAAAMPDDISDALHPEDQIEDPGRAQP